MFPCSIVPPPNLTYDAPRIISVFCYRSLAVQLIGSDILTIISKQIIYQVID